MLYTKRPLKVSAFRLESSNINSWPMWTRNYVVRNREEFNEARSRDNTTAIVPHKNGSVTVYTWYSAYSENVHKTKANVGDYIVKEPNGAIRVYTETSFNFVHEPCPVTGRVRLTGDKPVFVDFRGEPIFNLPDPSKSETEDVTNGH